MTRRFMEIASTPSVKAAQVANGSAKFYQRGGPASTEPDRFTEDEVSFITERDSFYMATVSEDGWPYIQHRGGPKGFLHVLDDRTLAFADYRGNRQYLSIGNAAVNDKVALFLMDCPHRTRLKVSAHMEIKSIDENPELLVRLMEGSNAKPERIIVLHLEAFDWNCPQHITPRFTESEVLELLASREG